MMTDNPASKMMPAHYRLTALAVAAVSVVAATGFLMVHWLRSPEVTEGNGGSGPVVVEMPGGLKHLFHEWTKPDLALVLTGEQHGYLGPCGCTEPQVGGLERRYNLVRLLQDDLGWKAALFDLGDVPQRAAPRDLPNKQGLLKYKVSMRALQKTGYTAVGVGDYEMQVGLDTVLGEFALNNPKPRVLAANLVDKDKQFPDQLGAWEIIEPAGSGLKVGVVGVVGPGVAEKVKDPNIKFDWPRNALPGLLKDLDAKQPDLRVLLYQDTEAKAELAAQAFPQFQVILCLCSSDEPSAKPRQVGNTLVVSVGHKGKHVGVVGVYRKPGGFDLRYQLVRLDPVFKTPDEKAAGHPIIAFMEEYTKDLKKGDYLHKYPQMPHELQVLHPNAKVEYVGSDTCKKCHGPAYDVWKTSKHSHAYQTLVDAKRPSLRQYDGECIVCHTVGFGYKTGFKDAETTPKLKDVGCESCHGPGGAHVANHNDPVWQKALNPWKAPENENEAAKKARFLRINDACRKCHDNENDATWDIDKKWPAVAHPTAP